MHVRYSIAGRRGLSGRQLNPVFEARPVTERA